MRRLIAYPTLQHCFAIEASVSTETAEENGGNFTVIMKNIIKEMYNTAVIYTFKINIQDPMSFV
jgi:hypothetical protein